MIYLPDTNACVTLLRGRNPLFAGRWQSRRSSEIVLCSVVVYELRFGAERCIHPAREHARLDLFLSAFASLPFDDNCAHVCSMIRRNLENTGKSIGPYDLQIAAIALHHGLTLVTHNTAEFSRVPNLRLEDWEA